MPVTAARYAAVTSTLALAVALGGSAYAATLIGTKNIKNGAVTTPKIANNAATGAKVNEGTLSTVPNASRVGNNLVDDLHLVGETDTQPRVIFQRAGLRVTAGCNAGNPSLPVLTATTTIAGSSVYTVVHGDQFPPPESPDEEDLETGEFGPGDAFDLLAGNPGNIGVVTFDFLAQDGKAVSGHVVTDSIGPGCTITGFAISDR